MENVDCWLCRWVELIRLSWNTAVFWWAGWSAVRLNIEQHGTHISCVIDIHFGLSAFHLWRRVSVQHKLSCYSLSQNDFHRHKMVVHCHKIIVQLSENDFHCHKMISIVKKWLSIVTKWFPLSQNGCPLSQNDCPIITKWFPLSQKDFHCHKMVVQLSQNYCPLSQNYCPLSQTDSLAPTGALYVGLFSHRSGKK